MGGGLVRHGLCEDGFRADETKCRHALTFVDFTSDLLDLGLEPNWFVTICILQPDLLGRTRRRLAKSLILLGTPNRLNDLELQRYDSICGSSDVLGTNSGLETWFRRKF